MPTEPTNLDGRLYCADLRPRRTNLLRALRKLQGPDRDSEACHQQADDLLLEYIGDREITEAFMAIERWYA